MRNGRGRRERGECMWVWEGRRKGGRRYTVNIPSRRCLPYVKCPEILHKSTPPPLQPTAWEKWFTVRIPICFVYWSLLEQSIDVCFPWAPFRIPTPPLLSRENFVSDTEYLCAVCEHGEIIYMNAMQAVQNRGAGFGWDLCAINGPLYSCQSAIINFFHWPGMH